mgnify:FL=1
MVYAHIVLLRLEGSLLWMRRIIKKFKDTIRPTNQGAKYEYIRQIFSTK